MAGSLRFIHASRLMLDHQLRGAGGCPSEVRTLVEDATLVAFERVIDACLAQHVDFLLLVGDSFERNDHGLRGQAALARGLARLEEHNIPAYVTSGRRDPWSAWLPGLRFSDNVYRVEPNAVPEVFERDGHALARICALDAHAFGEAPPTGLKPGRYAASVASFADAPFSIALVYWDEALRMRPAEDRVRSIQEWLTSRNGLGVDYWAFGGAPSTCQWAVDRGIAHDSGSPQALRSADGGPHGCTLWELNGQPRSTFIPTSPVRYESRSVALGEHWRKDDLLQSMRESLHGLQPQGHDAVWIVTWRFDGTGPLFEALQTPAFHGEVMDALRQETIPGVTLVHDLRVPVYVPKTIAEGDRFSLEYVRLLAERALQSPATLLAESAAAGSVWESRLAALLADLEDRELPANARGAGLRWFAAREGVSA